MLPCLYFYCFFFFFFNDTATTEIYPLSLHDALPIPTTASTWDAGNRLTQTVNSIAGTITRTYDGFDRLASETIPQGSVSYTYDAGGRRTSLTVAGQPTVVYAYDNANRLTSITQGSSLVTFGYDNADRRTSLTLPNGVTTTYAYDGASRLTGLTYALGATTLGTLTYGYDTTGNRALVGGSWARTGLPQPLTAATYNAANQQLTFSGLTLTYDLNGNVTSDGASSYTWNARDQLAAITGPVPASFVYDATGRRRGKTISGTTTNFLYDGINPIQEQVGASMRNLLTGLGVDEYLMRDDGGGARSFLTGALGSTLALADTTGALQAEYTYEPFGATTVTGSPGANALTYTGREDDGTGLKYYRARYYHPQLARFIQEDPIGFGGGINFYAYATNNPIRYVDPLGLFTVSLCIKGSASSGVSVGGGTCANFG